MYKYPEAVGNKYYIICVIFNVFEIAISVVIYAKEMIYNCILRYDPSKIFSQPIDSFLINRKYIVVVIIYVVTKIQKQKWEIQ